MRVLRRLGRVLFWCAAVFVMGSLLSVWVLRWVPPPTSAFMAGAWFTAIAHGNAAHRPEYQWVPRSQISPQIMRAVIAAEDQLFFEHDGFDFKAIRKALESNARGGRLRGASTISQQTAKNLFLWRGRSWLRKGLETWFTVLLETFWPKERILEVYLNIAEFGPGVYGVQAASNQFFGKSAETLTEREAALLAAVLPNPVRFQAVRPSAYVQRRADFIVGQMRRLPPMPRDR